MTSEKTVFIVDDDPTYLESISLLVQSMGWKTKTFSSAAEYFQQFDLHAAGCLILDVRMPVTGGLTLQEDLAKLPLCPPIIIMTGYAEVPTAMRAMRQGAIDFLQKTFSETELFEAIQRAMRVDTENREEYARKQSISERFALLTQAEHAVLQLVLRGDTNKQIAGTLDISIRAVEDRRAKIMHKLQVHSVAALVGLSIDGGVWQAR